MAREQANGRGERRGAQVAPHKQARPIATNAALGLPKVRFLQMNGYARLREGQGRPPAARYGEGADL